MLNINIQLGHTREISRKLDNLGRITIPVSFRNELGLNEEENPWAEIFLLDEGIFIRKKKFKYKGEK